MGRVFSLLLVISACSAQDVGAPVRLEILSSNESIAKGESSQLAAIIHYDDGTQADLSQQTIWHSSNAQVVSCDRTGWLRGLSAGRATVTAAAFGYSAELDVVIAPARLVGLRIGELYPSQVVGSRWYLHAEGFYSDEGVADLTGDVRWSSSNPEVAAVGTIANEKLPLVARAPGHARIVAALGSVETFTTLYVVPRRPERLEVLMTSPLMVPGEARPIHAVGTYADGSQLDVSEWVAWVSSSASVIVTPDEEGTKVRAGVPGHAVVSALFDDLYGATAIEVGAPASSL